MNLRQQLSHQHKTAWLEIGCNRNFEPGFRYLDQWPVRKIPPEQRPNYIRFDIVRANKDDWRSLGTYDLVRTQHVLEHFDYEGGVTLLKNIRLILKRGGYLILTVPDLRVFIQRYLNNSFNKWRAYSRWARKRIPNDAPASFYFSVYSHSLPKTPHKWCYDFAGIKYVLEAAGGYVNVRELLLTDPLSSIPFTHNRPQEDLCVLAIKK